MDEDGVHNSQELADLKIRIEELEKNQKDIITCIEINKRLIDKLVRLYEIGSRCE